jgi:hypothetical protein
MKRRVMIVVGLVAAQLALAASQAWANFPWAIPGG